MKTVIVTLTLSDEVANSLNKQGCKDSYVSELVERELTKIVKLGNCFKYDQISKTLFKGSIEIILTPTELRLFELLLRHKGKIVSMEDIRKGAWKGKNMTRFTLRNKIKTLRDRTFYELIKNHSNIGYSMEIN